ncbi:MAG: hypothetical protein ACRERU_16995 [Methylococcales bacterium]
MIRKIVLDRLFSSQRTRYRDLVLAMVIERLIRPCSKLATTRWWHTTTLAEVLSVGDAEEEANCMRRGRLAAGSTIPD